MKRHQKNDVRSRVRTRRLDREVNSILNGIALPEPWSVTEFVERVAQYRDRPIELLGHPMPVDGPHGLWCALDNVDVIVFDPETPVLQREHVILHEVGHILFRHDGENQDAEGDLSALGAAFVEQMDVRGRTTYRDSEERVAELFATAVWQWAGRHLVQTKRSLSGEKLETVDRFHIAMRRAPK